ncbi:hypothetical protein CEUSTIGMA_g3735.t1 [Chlamydomonas eustigma]|uniref:Mediator of RNA polymerase II transcription subunit 7 n=1 Tax=Chlamydomonas eustigma TaxID=1157962 RepID=A0A250X0K8_9CHLO|nr:hypothetical protein CEUSTIGMA_g3735.t1 [Chlamydomonas eustigma]|eukprot:GAX76290.1 hypothetical protein CEUSTIGMA_g3735.t1 [Chlamydomonas eustigma]
MAAEAAVLPSFPLPPPFYKLYATSVDNNVPLPPDPPPPPQGEFQLFGIPYDPEEAAVPRLQSRKLFEQGSDGSVDIKSELGRLNKEVIFVYSELLRVLVENPSGYVPTLNILNQVLDNMQHLLNMIRPEQARASLEYALKLQIQEKEEAIANLKSQAEAVDKAVVATAKQMLEQSSRGSELN